MRVRDRLINGALNAVGDFLFLVLTLLLYSLLSTLLLHVMPNIIPILREFLVIIVAFTVLAFLKGVLSGHVFAYPVLLGEIVLVTAIFTSVPSTVTVGSLTVSIRPVIVFVWSIEAAWVVYSLIDQFNAMLKDP